MKFWRPVTVAACLTAVSWTVFLYGAANEGNAGRDALEQELKEALKARAVSALNAYEATEAAYQAETATLDALEDAIKELAEAEVALATTPEDEIAALKRYVDRTKSLERVIKRLFEAGSRRGEANQYWTARRERETAEIILLATRIKAASKQ